MGKKEEGREKKEGGTRKREGGRGALEGSEAITDNLPSPKGLRS
jgi:hypothetical protein